MSDQQTTSLAGTIHERMDLQGELYSVARRQVISDHARLGVDRAAWPHAVSGSYDVVGGGLHHDAALLHNVLRAVGVTAPHTGEPFSEAILLGVGGGLGFAYRVNDCVGYYPTVTVVTTPTDLITRALDRLAVSHLVQHAPNATLAERNLSDALAAGATPICTVDRMGLPWHGCVDLVGGADPHALTVLGGDAILWFDDECVRPTPMMRQFFLAAWGWFVRGRHRLVRIDPAATVGRDLGLAVREGVATTVARLSRPRVASSTYDSAAAQGIAGMRTLTAHLADSRSAAGWQRRYANPEVFFHALRRLHDSLDVDRGGPGAARPLYARFLEEASMAALADWWEPAELFRQSGTEWSGIASDIVVAHPAFVDYDDLLTERLLLQLQHGTDAAEAIAAVNMRMAALAATYAADPLPPGDRRQLLDRLAARIARAVRLEERAVRGLAAAIAR